jgi:hypothetical protein
VGGGHRQTGDMISIFSSLEIRLKYACLQQILLASAMKELTNPPTLQVCLINPVLH